MQLITKTSAIVSQLLVGIVFLVSALAKAWGGGEFADLLLQYGPAWFSIAAPLVIAVETALATMLLLRIYPKQTSLCAAIFTLGISLVYAYGILFKNVTDCGCFGVLHQLNLSPTGTFIRNAILIGLGLVGYWFYPADRTAPAWWRTAIATLLIAASTFICGLDMSNTFELPSLSSQHAKATLTYDKLNLNDVLPLSSDSTYAVYLFSFTCAYCQDSYANVEQYTRLKNIDGVYGVAVENETGEERFRRLYQPSIPVFTIPEKRMASVTAELPLLIIIDHGQITKVHSGGVVSPFISIK